MPIRLSSHTRALYCRHSQFRPPFICLKSSLLMLTVQESVIFRGPFWLHASLCSWANFSLFPGGKQKLELPTTSARNEVHGGLGASCPDGGRQEALGLQVPWCSATRHRLFGWSLRPGGAVTGKDVCLACWPPGPSETDRHRDRSALSGTGRKHAGLPRETQRLSNGLN